MKPEDEEFTTREDGGHGMNAAAHAMRALQQEMAGEAQRAGIASEGEAMDIVSDMRRHSSI